MDKIIYFFSASRDFGGAERVLVEIESIVSKKLKTIFVVNKESNFFINKNNVIKINNKFKISVSKISIFYFIFYSFLIIKKIFGKGNKIFYCNDLESVFLALPLKAFFFNSKLVWHIHDIYDFRKNKNKILFLFLNFFVDHFICITYKNKERISPFVSKNIFVINNFSRYTPLKTRKFFEPKNRIVFGFVGQITQWKRIDLVIDAFKSLVISNNSENKYFLKIIGRPYFKSDLDYYKLLRFKSYNFNNIVWEPFDLELSSFYKSIDFLVTFSTNEPFGLVILEAMSFGVPVVSTLGDGPNEILNDSNGFLINENSNEGIIKKFTELNYQDSLLYSKISGNAINTVQSFYTIDVFSNNVNSVFTKI